ncbi:MAG: 4-vinyl reductase [Chloroflexi bacterium]|nr:MAG: 4-vinyl reductase [Chloroflexota bacterium]RLC90901.1 MAG: 4-vinyl reductase [Chloroflexota bacterium]
MEEVMGKNGLNAILNLAGLSHLIDNYPPPNLNKEFDFADYSTLNGALEEMYGPRGGRGLQLRAGRASFAQGVRMLGAMVGVSDLAFRVLPLSAKLKAGLPAMAKVFTQFSDQKSTVEDRGDYYAYIMNPCPVCWGRKADRPICFAGKGLLEEGLHWVSGGRKFRVEEIECVAMGQPTCTYAIYKEPIG